jgi:hypothetical protein
MHVTAFVEVQIQVLFGKSKLPVGGVAKLFLAAGCIEKAAEQFYFMYNSSYIILILADPDVEYSCDHQSYQHTSCPVANSFGRSVFSPTVFVFRLGSCMYQRRLVPLVA